MATTIRYGRGELSFAMFLFLLSWFAKLLELLCLVFLPPPRDCLLALKENYRSCGRPLLAPSLSLASATTEAWVGSTLGTWSATHLTLRGLHLAEHHHPTLQTLLWLGHHHRLPRRSSTTATSSNRQLAATAMYMRINTTFYWPILVLLLSGVSWDGSSPCT
jgi:hypothetical protein